MAKCLDIQNLIFKEKLDIVCLNETNLMSDIDTSSLDLPINYSIIHFYGKTVSQITAMVAVVSLYLKESDIN